MQIPLRRSSHPWLHSSKERTLNETSRKTFHQTLVTRLPLCGTGASQRCSHPFPGGYSAVAPPDPIPNSEVKRSCADGSVNPHARVGHRQGLYPSNAFPSGKAFVFARHVRPPPAIQAASAPRCEVHRHAVAVHLARRGASARPIAHRVRSYNDAVPSVGAHSVRDKRLTVCTKRWWKRLRAFARATRCRPTHADAATPLCGSSCSPSRHACRRVLNSSLRRSFGA